MPQPRIMLVSHYFEPSASTGAKRSTLLARYLADHGAGVTIVTASPAFYGEHVTARTGVRDALAVHEVAPPRAADRLRRMGLPGRWALNYLTCRRYARAIRNAVDRDGRPDFLYFCGNPFWYFGLGRRFLRSSGIPYILDFEDLWYAGGVTYRLGHRGGVRRILDRLLEAHAVADASAVIHTTPAQTRLSRARYGDEPGSKFWTIRWGYDERALRDIVPARTDAGALRLAIFGKFASYGDVDAAVLACSVAAIADDFPVEVLHIGTPEPGLERAFAEAGVAACLKQPGRISYAEGLGMLASADGLVLNTISEVSHPAKVYDYIGLNRPVIAIASTGSALGELLSSFAGACVATGPDEVTAALRRLRAGECRELQPGLDASEYSQQHQFGILMDRLATLERQGGND